MGYINSCLMCRESFRDKDSFEEYLNKHINYIKELVNKKLRNRNKIISVMLTNFITCIVTSLGPEHNLTTTLGSFQGNVLKL